MTLISLIKCKQCRSFEQLLIDLLSKFSEILTHVETKGSISFKAHNLTGPHQIDLWFELFPVGGEFVKVWLFWWVISDTGHGPGCSAAQFSSLQPPTLQTPGTGPHFVSSPAHYERWDHESESDHGKTLRFDNSQQEQTQKNCSRQEKQSAINLRFQSTLFTISHCTDWMSSPISPL